MAKQTAVISHWYQLIENFQTSSMTFYHGVQAAVERRQVPEIHSTRVEFKEGGLASTNREYLRIHRGKHSFDVCAAPFGTGFFVSWWLTEPRLAHGILRTLGFFLGLTIGMDVAYNIGFAIGKSMYGFTFGVLFGFLSVFFGLPALLWLIGNSIRAGTTPGESTILAMQLVGRIYERVFTPTTYYSIDTALMFQESVHNAVLEVVDEMTANKGVRVLTETDRKPVLKKFAASA